jgi:hypothetical protein
MDSVATLMTSLTTLMPSHTTLMTSHTTLMTPHTTLMTPHTTLVTSHHERPAQPTQPQALLWRLIGRVCGGGTASVLTMDSAVFGLGALGCDCCTVRVFGRNLRSKMQLSFAPLLRLKRCHACDQCHSYRLFLPLTGWHCKSRPNTEGEWVGAGCSGWVLTMNSATPR